MNLLAVLAFKVFIRFVLVKVQHCYFQLQFNIFTEMTIKKMR